MRRTRFRTRPAILEIGADGYQEFAAGTVPVKDVIAVGMRDWGCVVLVEHARGYLVQLDHHLDSIREGHAPADNVDYLATWAGMTAADGRPALVRLELALTGLRARPRLLFKGSALAPLWLLTQGAQIGLLLDPDAKHLAYARTWLMCPTVRAKDLRKILEVLDVCPPPPQRRGSPCPASS
jgi:hypothetical protein